MVGDRTISAISERCSDDSPAERKHGNDVDRNARDHLGCYPRTTQFGIGRVRSTLARIRRGGAERGFVAIELCGGDPWRQSSCLPYVR